MKTEALSGFSRAIEALRRIDPGAHAFHLYDLDALVARAQRFRAAFASLSPLAAYAVKANGLPAILDCLNAQGVGAEAGSVGELELALGSGFEPRHCVSMATGARRKRPSGP